MTENICGQSPGVIDRNKALAYNLIASLIITN